MFSGSQGLSRKDKLHSLEYLRRLKRPLGSGVRLLDNLEQVSSSFFFFFSESQFPFCAIGITIELTYVALVELNKINASKMLSKVFCEK